MRTLKGIGRWIEDRSGLISAAQRLLEHPIPPDVGAARHVWWYVLGMGTLTAFVVQAFTGVALAAVYIPSTESAYDSIQYITDSALFGRFVRGMHYFGASAMVVLVTLHMARVFLTGSFKFPRELGWLSGVALLFLTLGLAYTGMVLRWDEDSLGSVLVGAEQAGRAPIIGEPLARLILAGETISGATLTRFYALHVFVLPGLLIAVLALHLYLVIRNGISEPPAAGQPVDRGAYRAWYRQLLTERGKPYWPAMASRELAFAGVVVLGIAVLAATFGPRALSGPPDPTLTDVDPSPDWYFVWYQAYLEVLPGPVGEWAIVFTPLLVAVTLLLLPFVANAGERSPARRPWAVGGVVVLALFVLSFFITGVRAPFRPAFDTEPLNAAALGLPESAQAGALLFHAKGCQYCHMVRGEGGGYGPKLDDAAARLNEADLTVIILRGRRDMPAYRGRLTEEELAVLIEFLEALDPTARGAAAGR